MRSTPRLLHGVDIGAEVQLRGEQLVAAAVAGEKGDAAAFQLAENEAVGGFAERSGYGFFSEFPVRPGME